MVLNHIYPHPLARWTGSRDDLSLLQTLLDVNLQSYVHLASAALPWLQQSAGSIIVMSSLAGTLVVVVVVVVEVVVAVVVVVVVIVHP